MTVCTYGFRIAGGTWEARRLVDAAAALSAYANCDDRAEVHREAYLSAFQYGEDFGWQLLETGSTAGFVGPCCSPWLWFDIDAANDLERGRREVVRLGMELDKRYKLGDEDLLVFFSGAKGFHLGLPTWLWSPMPTTDFHKVARQFAIHAAERAAVKIDEGVYDKVRAFRAPNSRHPKTGLHKRRFTLDELAGLSLDTILDLSREPAPFDLPESTENNDQAIADWQAAVRHVATAAEAKAARRVATGGAPTLNRSTLAFIRDGADEGDRHRMLFSAAANLAEFGCPHELAFALLEEAGLDSGLMPKDVYRQIECGLGGTNSLPPRASSGSLPQSVGQVHDAPPDADIQAALARLWNQDPAGQQSRDVSNHDSQRGSTT